MAVPAPGGANSMADVLAQRGPTGKILPPTLPRAHGVMLAAGWVEGMGGTGEGR